MKLGRIVEEKYENGVCVSRTHEIECVNRPVKSYPESGTYWGLAILLASTMMLLVAHVLTGSCGSALL